MESVESTTLLVRRISFLKGERESERTLGYSDEISLCAPTDGSMELVVENNPRGTL